MENLNEEAIKELANVVVQIAKEISNESSFDITTLAKIISKNSISNTYTIEINGVRYNNVKTKGGICDVNEIVNVLIPKNNYNNMIIDKSGGGNIPTMSSTVKGGAKLGKGLIMEGETLNVNGYLLSYFGKISVFLNGSFDTISGIMQTVYSD